MAAVITNHASFCLFLCHLKTSLIGPRIIYHGEALHGRRYCFRSSFALVNVSFRSVLLDTMSIRMSLLSDNQQAIETESTTDITPEPTSTTWLDSWQSLSLDTWFLEGISAAFSNACFIALCGVLLAYNNKPEQKLAFDLSLNAIVAILATACRSSLVLTVSEATSQLKWV
ncbi:hypothetical protein BJX62DRAFT_212060 [Aspergillus germanicus]